jgi:hypothetical protein
MGPGALALPLALRVDGEQLLLDAEGEELFELVANGDWWGLFPGCLTDPEVFTPRLLDPRDPLDLRGMWRVATAIITGLCGTDWWAGQRLAALARSAWFDLDGWCAERGVDPALLPLHRLCALTYRWQASYAQTEAELLKLRSQVFDPPRSLPRLGIAPWTREQEAAGFASTMANLGALGGLRTS